MHNVKLLNLKYFYNNFYKLFLFLFLHFLFNMSLKSPFYLMTQINTNIVLSLLLSEARKVELMLNLYH